MNELQTILMVDDSENDLFLMREAFKQAEFNGRMQEVTNGEEAIAYLRGDGPYRDRHQFPMPTVVLLDLNMPMMDGFAVLAWMSTQPAFKRLMVIMLTASMRPDDVNRAFDLGVKSFLVKPSNLDDLIAMLSCLCAWLGYNHFPRSNEAVTDSARLGTALL